MMHWYQLGAILMLVLRVSFDIVGGLRSKAMIRAEGYTGIILAPIVWAGLLSALLWFGNFWAY